jgi:hypothetical protein
MNLTWGVSTWALASGCPPLFSLILLYVSQHRSLTAIGQKKASFHSSVFTRDTRGLARLVGSGFKKVREYSCCLLEWDGSCRDWEFCLRRLFPRWSRMSWMSIFNCNNISFLEDSICCAACSESNDFILQAPNKNLFSWPSLFYVFVFLCTEHRK